MVAAPALHQGNRDAEEGFLGLVDGFARHGHGVGGGALLRPSPNHLQLHVRPGDLNL